MNKREKQMELYDNIVSKCSGFKMKGKTLPYTSAMGYIFSLLNISAEIGFRFSKDIQIKYISEFKTKLYESKGAILKGNFLITNELKQHNELRVDSLDERFD